MAPLFYCANSKRIQDYPDFKFPESPPAAIPADYVFGLSEQNAGYFLSLSLKSLEFQFLHLRRVFGHLPLFIVLHLSVLNGKWRKLSTLSKFISAW
jgi:hypothetical protein